MFSVRMNQPARRHCPRHWVHGTSPQNRSLRRVGQVRSPGAARKRRDGRSVCSCARRRRFRCGAVAVGVEGRRISTSGWSRSLGHSCRGPSWSGATRSVGRPGLRAQNSPSRDGQRVPLAVHAPASDPTDLSVGSPSSSLCPSARRFNLCAASLRSLDETMSYRSNTARVL